MHLLFTFFFTDVVVENIKRLNENKRLKNTSLVMLRCYCHLEEMGELLSCLMEWFLVIL